MPQGANKLLWLIMVDVSLNVGIGRIKGIEMKFADDRQSFYHNSPITILFAYAAHQAQIVQQVPTRLLTPTVRGHIYTV